MARRSTAAAQRGPGHRFAAIGDHERTRVTAFAQEQSRVEREPTRPLLVEAVAQTPGEHVGPFLRVGSENGHLVRHADVVRREVVAHGCSGVPLRERAAAFRDGFVRQPPSKAAVRVRSFQDSLVRKYSAYGVPANFSPSSRDISSSELRGR